MQNSKCKQFSVRDNVVNALPHSRRCFEERRVCILHFALTNYLNLTDTDMPSEPGDTTEVKRPGCVWMVLRNGSMSAALLTTLCARKTPPGSRRGKTMSKNRL